MQFLSYQRAFINDTSPLKLLEKSRRIGGSFAVAYSVFQKLMKLKNHDITVITKDQNLGFEFVRDVHRFGRAWNLKNPTDAIPESCFTKTQFRIPHKGGESRLLMVSSNPNAAAGRGGSLILDEMALHDQPELLLTIAMPIITCGGQVTILSTHRSKSSVFNRLVQDTLAGKLNFSLHKTTIYDALDAGFLEKVVNRIRQKEGNAPMERDEFIEFIKNDVCLGDPNRFEQEYLAIPSEAQFNLIPESLVLDACRGPEWTNGETYLGWDIATSESGDYSCISIIERKLDNSVHLIHQEAKKGEELAQQRERIKTLVREYRVRKLCLDGTGIGTDSSQILTKHFGDYMCEGVVFSVKTKDEMASRMLDIFQSKSIVLPNDPAIVKDISSVEKIYGSTGMVTYHAPRIDGSHGDRFWSLGLALRAAGWKRQATEIIPIHKPLEMSSVPNDRVERNRREDQKVPRRPW